MLTNKVDFYTVVVYSTDEVEMALFHILATDQKEEYYSRAYNSCVLQHYITKVCSFTMAGNIKSSFKQLIVNTN